MKWRAGSWRGGINLTVQSQLTVLRPQTVDEFEAVVETDLTGEEIACIENGLAEYTKHPETAISFDDFIAREYPVGLPPVKCHLRYAEEAAGNS
ncbi:hypothetical protein FACS1894139_09850 [Planctomycetales bacterium]|nr:hypothetical protein FACS1894107_01850 [Planctomycetales bacterium]GHS97177.1 hypothetical protein FACS1894108_03100 [Planctomycetales bacterium]GHT05650.1 hypothetical protein FACS1894139_09850 [Planctomycetales bacterium]